MSHNSQFEMPPPNESLAQDVQQPLPPGLTIELATVRDIDRFETQVVEEVLPPKSEYPGVKQLWEARKKLSELVLPQKFYGRAENITLTTMERPYDQLIEYRKTAVRKNEVQARAHTIGFHISALLHSTRKKNLGLLSTDFWISQREYNIRTRNYTGYTLGEYSRFIRINTVLTGEITRITEQSAQISEQLLKHGIQYPYLGGFETRRTYKAN